MRPRSYVAIGLALTLAGLVAPAVAQDQGGYQDGRLRYVEPGVTLQRANDASAEEALGNEPFLPGDRIWTDAAGRVEFQFPDGSLVRLDRRSKLDYAGREDGREERTGLRLWSGSVVVHAGSRSAARFEVETPGGIVTAFESSVVRVDVDGSEARVSVYAGEAQLDDGRTRQRLAADERTFARWGEAAREPERFDPYERDEFAAWDEERESQIRTAEASRHLPGDLAIYSDELDRNGDWRYDPSAGYVWVPQVDPGWQPYSNGHWAWTTYGWTWVPNEHWGWAPFHYGRWDYAASFGWYWVPGRTWGPAWVSWAVGGGYVGWCPLGRYDRPVVAWGDHGGHYYGLDRGNAVSRGRFASGSPGGWSMVRSGELGRRDVRRVAVDRIDPALVHAADSASLRPTRDAMALRPAGAVPRAVSTKQTPGDFVRELGVDNMTTIPAPWTRGYGPPPAGAEGARYGVPKSTDSDRREAVGRVPAGRGTASATAPAGAPVAAPAEAPSGTAAPRGGRPVPWLRPADEGQRGSGGSGGAGSTASGNGSGGSGAVARGNGNGSGNAGATNPATTGAGARSAPASGNGSATRDDGAAQRRQETTFTPRWGGNGEGARSGGNRSSGGSSESARPAGGEVRSSGGEVRSTGGVPRPSSSGESRSSGGGGARPSGGGSSSGGSSSSGGGSSSGGHAVPRPHKN